MLFLSIDLGCSDEIPTVATLSTIYKEWEAAKFDNPQCLENFMQKLVVQRGAQEVRKKFVATMDRYKLNIVFS